MKHSSGKDQWGLIISFLVFLLLIQILFSIPAPAKWLEAVWEAGDLISFVGTITLGIIAITQTEHESNTNKRLMQLEENRYKLEIRPFVMLSDWSVSIRNTREVFFEHGREKLFVCVSKGNTDEQFCLALTLTNTTQSYVSVTYNGICYTSNDSKVNWSCSYANNPNVKLILEPGHSGELIFWGNQKGVIDPIKGKNVEFSLIMENRFGERYQETIKAIVLVMEAPRAEDLPYVAIHTQNYRIGKFVQGTDGKLTLI